MNEGARVIAVIAVLFLGFMIPVKDTTKKAVNTPVQAEKSDTPDNGNRENKAIVHYYKPDYFVVVKSSVLNRIPILDKPSNHSKPIGYFSSGDTIKLISWEERPEEKNSLLRIHYKMQYKEFTGYCVAGMFSSLDIESPMKMLKKTPLPKGAQTF